MVDIETLRSIADATRLVAEIAIYTALLPFLFFVLAVLLKFTVRYLFGDHEVDETESEKPAAREDHEMDPAYIKRLGRRVLDPIRKLPAQGGDTRWS